ncbi:MAG TPA: hypothetical protein VFD05_01810 [Bacilli bacterium]|nr:hypothetical protein [Bacilli bacterium]
MKYESLTSFAKYHKKLYGRYIALVAVSLFVYFLSLSLMVVLHLWLDVDLFAPLHVPLSISGAFLVVAVFLVLFYRFLFRRYEKELTRRFYESAQKLGFTFEVLKTKKVLYDYAELFNEAGLYYANEFTKVAAFELGNQQIYMLFFSEAEEKTRVVLHLPERHQKYYYQINNGNYAPPAKFRDHELLKLHFVHKLALNYYASSNDTEVKIYLRKTLEKRFQKLYETYGKTLAYIAFPDHEFLNINDASDLKALKLSKPQSKEKLSERLNTLLIYQKLIYIMLEKREPWPNN